MTAREEEVLALARRVFVVEGHRTYFAEHPSIVGLQLVDLIEELRGERDALALARSVIGDMVRLGVIHTGNGEVGGYYVGENVIPTIMGRALSLKETAE